MDIAHLIQTIAVYAIPVLLAITLHEAAHAYAARHYGDDTAYMLGRVSLNPLNHIDPVGTVLMPLMLYFATSGAFIFGYAKPVPVRFDRLRQPKQNMVWVALAGPASNFVQALIWGAGLIIWHSMGVEESFLLKMCEGGILVNVVMFAFNLFPLPPLDGGRILVGLLPNTAARAVLRIEPWGFFIVLGLVLLHVIDALWLRPVMGLTLRLMQTVLRPVADLLS